MSSVDGDPAANLVKVSSYIKAARLEEAERLLIGVLREAEEGTELHWDGLLALTELYEQQERYREGLILSRDFPQKLAPESERGRRGLRLRARLHQAEGEHEAAQMCLDRLGSS